MNNTRKALSAAIACLILIMFAGCAALPPPPTKQETLEERVKNYMQAQVKKNWGQAYSFFDTSSRDKVTRDSYLSQTRKMAYNGFAIEEITVLPSGDKATVKVRIDIAFMGYVFPRAPQTQEWVKEGGAWFVKHKAAPRITPFDKPQKNP
jgi:hypothetical protein